MSNLQSQMETATQHCFEQTGLLAFPVLPHQLLTPGVPQHSGLEAVLNSSPDLPLTVWLENCPSVHCNYTCKWSVWQSTEMPLSRSTIKKPKVKKLYWFLALTPTQVFCGRTYWRSASSRKYFVPETHAAWEAHFVSSKLSSSHTKLQTFPKSLEIPALAWLCRDILEKATIKMRHSLFRDPSWGLKKHRSLWPGGELNMTSTFHTA